MRPQLFSFSPRFRPLFPAQNIQSLHNIPCRRGRVASPPPSSPIFDSAATLHVASKFQPSRRRARRPPAGHWRRRRRSLPLCIKKCPPLLSSPLFCSVLPESNSLLITDLSHSRHLMYKFYEIVNSLWLWCSALAPSSAPLLARSEGGRGPFLTLALFEPLLAPRRCECCPSKQTMRHSPRSFRRMDAREIYGRAPLFQFTFFAEIRPQTEPKRLAVIGLGFMTVDSLDSLGRKDISWARAR